MAGKPEPPHHIQHQQQAQQQPPSVQNVVVYVSNDNFTQAYAVNHQNVASYQHQTQQNGGEPGVYNNSTQSVASLVVPGKTICKPPVKTQDFSNNSVVGGVAEPHTPGFYATSASSVNQTNGFHHCHSPSVLNNLMYGSNSAGHSGAILNPSFSAASLKNIVNLGGQTIGQQQAVCPTVETPPVLGVNGELCNGYALNPHHAQNHTRVTVSCAQPFFSGPEQKTSVSHSDASGATVSLPASNYISSQGGDGNFVTVMGGDGSGAPASSGSVVFPRCDSVRSEAAESSCSSLSSADSQPDGSGPMALLLQPTGSVSHQSTTPTTPGNHHQFAANGNNSVMHQGSGGATLNNGMMMLNNNVQPTSQQAAGLVRTANGAISLSQQQLGNIVLAMTVNNNQQLPVSTVSASPVNPPITPSLHMPTVPTPSTISVPLGWKRLIVNGSIVYISPSNTALSSLEHLKEYLSTQGTCKCGLECPLRCDAVFNFDPKVSTKPWSMPPESTASGDLTKLCNHKRKLVAMASLAANSTGGGGAGAVATTTTVAGSTGTTPTTVAVHPSQAPAPHQQQQQPHPAPATTPSGMADSQAKAAKKDPSSVGLVSVATGAAAGTVALPLPLQLQPLAVGPAAATGAAVSPGGGSASSASKRKKRRPTGAYSGVSVSQLLAQRERAKDQQQCWSGTSTPPLLSGGGVPQHHPGALPLSANRQPFSAPSQPYSADPSQHQQTQSPQPQLTAQFVRFSGPDGNQSSGGIVVHSTTNTSQIPEGNVNVHIGTVPPHQHPMGPSLAENGVQLQGPGAVAVGTNTFVANGNTLMVQNGGNINVLGQQQRLQSHQVNLEKLTSQHSQQQTQQHHLVYSSPHVPQDLNMFRMQQMFPQHQQQQQQQPPQQQSHQTHSPIPQQLQQQQQQQQQQQHAQYQTPPPPRLEEQNVNKIPIHQPVHQRQSQSQQFMPVTSCANNMQLQQQQPQTPQQLQHQFMSQSQLPQQTQNVAEQYGVRSQQAVVVPQNLIQMQHLQHQQQQSQNPHVQQHQQPQNQHSLQQQSMASQFVTGSGNQIAISNSPGGSGTSSPLMIQPQRTPPWQNRNNINTSTGGTNTAVMTMHTHHQNQPVVALSPQPNQVQQGNMNNTSNSTNNSNNSIPSTGFDRVPPLHHHTPPPPVWPEDTTRKKQKAASSKANSATKKQRPYNLIEHQQQQRVNNIIGMVGVPTGLSGLVGTVGQGVETQSPSPCPNVDVRQIPPEHNRPPPASYSGSPGNSIPSFMEDPSGYLAQQTALLNSTISRQTGVNPVSSGPSFSCNSPARNTVAEQSQQSPQLMLQPQQQLQQLQQTPVSLSSQTQQQSQQSVQHLQQQQLQTSTAQIHLPQQLVQQAQQMQHQHQAQAQVQHTPQTHQPSQPHQTQQSPSPVVSGVVVNLPTSCSSPATVVGVPIPSNIILPNAKGMYTSRNNANNTGSPQHSLIFTSQPQNLLPLPNTGTFSVQSATHLQPDSSVVSDMVGTETHAGCQGCAGTTQHQPIASDALMFHQHQQLSQQQSQQQPPQPQLQQSMAQQHQHSQIQHQTQLSQQTSQLIAQEQIMANRNHNSANDLKHPEMTNSLTPSPDENPVTSSTFTDPGSMPQRRHNQANGNESRGPIQGGTVSTSNGSPMIENYNGITATVAPQPESSLALSSSSSSSTPTPPARPETASSTNSAISSSSSPSASSPSTASSPFAAASGSPPYSYASISYQQSPLTRSEANVVCSSSASAVKQHTTNSSSNTNSRTNNENFCQHVLEHRLTPVPGAKFIASVSGTLQAVVTTMASGHTVSSNTITSVLAGRANTATVSVGSPAPVSAPSAMLSSAMSSAPVYTSQTAAVVSITPSVPHLSHQQNHQQQQLHQQLQQLQQQIHQHQLQQHQQQLHQQQTQQQHQQQLQQQLQHVHQQQQQQSQQQSHSQSQTHVSVQQSSHQLPQQISQHLTPVTKSPLEMVQSVVSSIQVPQNVIGNSSVHQSPNQQQQQQPPPPPQSQQQQQATTQAILKQSGAHGLPPGHILVSSGGQLIMANTGNVVATGPAANLMAPPPPHSLPSHSVAKLPAVSAANSGATVTTMPPISVSPMVTSVTAAVTQVIPAVGVAQQVLGQPTVLVNTLSTPLLIQPSMMTMDGMQNTVQIPHLAVTGNVIHHPQHQQSSQIVETVSQEHGSRTVTNSHSFIQRTSTQQPQHPLLSPDPSHQINTGSNKKKSSKKRKVSPQTVASMLHIASQQNASTGLVVQQHQPSAQQQQQQQNFSQQSFTVSGPTQSLTTGPMLQALTIVPGKGGAPAQILMNGQPGTATAATAGHFGTQQIIATSATSQPTQQINLLQPVNLLNGTTGVVTQNFPTFQQFIVPGLGGMVMATTADGTATLLPDTTNLGVQLQLQNVNGQNILTPVQNHPNSSTVFSHPAAAGQSILAAGPAGMVIRTPASSNNNGKINTHAGSTTNGSPQFLATGSPNQFLMNGAAFSGQLSPLVASVSPNQQVSFTTTSPGARSGTSGPTQHTPQQEFIQCGQMGQTLVVPCTVATSTTQNHQNTTVVQQNTTIVQQQTTMVSNNQQIVAGPQHFVQGTGGNNSNNVAALNVNQNYILSNNTNSTSAAEKVHQSVHQNVSQTTISSRQIVTTQPPQTHGQPMMKHSVSTQTAVNQSVQASASAAVMSTALVVTTNNTCQTSTTSSCSGSPPDTTTHSPVDPSVCMDGCHPQSPTADTTTHSTGVGSTDDSLSSPSPCPVSGSCGDATSRHQAASQVAMPMVHCVSSSNEQIEAVLSEQAEFDWNSKVFLNQITAEGDTNNQFTNKFLSGGTDVVISVSQQGHQGCGEKPPTDVFVESSTVPAGLGVATFSDLTKQQEVVSTRQIFEFNSPEVRTLDGTKLGPTINITTVERSMKRKHGDLLIMDSKEIHFADDDEDPSSGSSADKGKVSESSQTQEKRGGLSEGDLVWGAARGCPAWPGKLMGNASTGKVWVRWFGGERTLAQVDVSALKTLSEGLEAHHRARKKCRKSRKLNSQLENAIQEAMLELDRITEEQQQKQQLKKVLERPEEQMPQQLAQSSTVDASSESSSRPRRHR